MAHVWKQSVYRGFLFRNWKYVFFFSLFRPSFAFTRTQRKNPVHYELLGISKSVNASIAMFFFHYISSWNHIYSHTHTWANIDQPVLNAWIPFFGFIWLLCAMSKNKCFAIARQRCINFYRFEPVILRGYVFLNCNHFRFCKFLQIITLSYISKQRKKCVCILGLLTLWSLHHIFAFICRVYIAILA